MTPETATYLKKRYKTFFNIPLKGYTSLRTGGPADAVVFPANASETAGLFSFCNENGVPVTVIGGGTNLLVRDGGVRGICLIQRSVAEPEIFSLNGSGLVRVRAAAGISLKRLVSFCINKGLSGLNFAVGIPGTLGGAVMGNAGTPDGSMMDVIDRFTVSDMNSDIVTIMKDDIRFGYRSMDIKKADAAMTRFVILEAELILSRGETEALAHEAREKSLKRNMTQPLGKWSAGSFFKNPPGEKPAGWLIEKAGMKGAVAGGAMVSQKHANFIINTGCATSSDILMLKEMVQDKVEKIFGIRLKEEVRIIGEK